MAATTSQLLTIDEFRWLPEDDGSKTTATPNPPA